jgi:hypothetical protein
VSRVRRLVAMARPLPECRLCETPTHRESWLANGGLCSDCADGIAATVRMVGLRPLPDDGPDQTVMVEGYRPPVPGQLTIDGEEQP